MWGEGWRKFSKKVTSYYDPPSGACGAGFDIMTPPPRLLWPPPSKFFVVFHLLEKVINVLYIPKKRAAGANLGKFSFISPLNGCILVKSNGKMDINFQLALSGFLFFRWDYDPPSAAFAAEFQIMTPPTFLHPPSHSKWQLPYSTIFIA